MNGHGVDPPRGRSQDRLSIGVVCFPTLGGSSIVATELAGGLAGRGHRVHVIATAPPRRSPPAGERLSFHSVSVSDHPPFDHPPYALAVASAIVEVVESHALDLLHVHYAVPHAASAYLARQVLGAQAPRVVTTLHGTDVTRVGVDPSYRSVTCFAVARSDGITVPSDFLRGAARRLLGLDGFPIEVIPNFVDTDHFVPAAPRDRSRIDALFPAAGTADRHGPILFHVSNFRSVKRVPDLVEALARIRANVPARLVLVGDGPERKATAERARQLGIAECVCFLGNRPDFGDDLSQADAFLLASESESFGVAALEALSSGVPVFAYRVGGLSEVVTGDVGVLVEPFDVEALAAAVLGVVTDPAKQAAFRHAARARALARFRREPALDRYEAYFRRIMAAAPSFIPGAATARA